MMRLLRSKSNDIRKIALERLSARVQSKKIVARAKRFATGRRINLSVRMTAARALGRRAGGCDLERQPGIAMPSSWNFLYNSHQ